MLDPATTVHHKPKGIALLAAVFSTSLTLAAGPQDFHVDAKAGDILETYCIDCHDDATTKGDVRLDQFESIPLEARLDLMNRMQEKLFLGEMPPKKKDQPTEAERDELIAWLSKELRTHNASKLEEKLRMPEFGNAIDHGKLFSGKYKDLPGSTPDRRWLISEFIFDAKFNNLLGLKSSRDIDGKRRQIIGDNNRNGVNLTNPFLLPARSGVRYYDTTSLDGGHLLTMITNSKEASAYMISLAKRKNYLPVVEKIMATEWEHEKILAARESYLKDHVEDLLREIFPNKHENMLPAFVPTKPEPAVQAAGPDGKPLKKSNFDIAAPAREELDQIWAAMRRNSEHGEKDEALITKCERDWFLFGVNERSILLRVNFMRSYMEDLLKRQPKANPASSSKPPSDTELAIIRAAVMKNRKDKDRYAAVIARCMEGWQNEFRNERLNSGAITDVVTGALVDELFGKILERGPSPQEKSEYQVLAKSYFENLGNERTIDKLIQTLILRSDFVYRNEFGEGNADSYGRRMLSPRDASYAIAYALTDSSPDKLLAEAAADGRLQTREDYRREVERMLKDRSQYYMIDEAVERMCLADTFTNMPVRKLRFFREFFGYPAMLPIFKDNKRFGGNYTEAAGRLVAEADMLVAHILDEDKDVFERLLTTEDFYVYHSGDNAAMAASVEHIRKIYDYFKDKDWRNFDEEALKSHMAFLKEVPVRGVSLEALADANRSKEALGIFKTAVASYTERLNKGQTAAVPFPAFSSHEMTESHTRGGKQMRGAEVAKSFNLDMANWNYPVTQPARMEHRKGILTHPAWLIAFAANTATDPIRRGKWVREKLLAGTVPDVPVTVDAVIPEDPHNTLRGRLEKVTKVEYCWGCHERMNPLGLSFEMYDDFGRYRMDEFLEHPDNLIKKLPDKGPPQDDLRDIYKTLPVDTSGYLRGTDDKNLDGDVSNAIDLTERLAKSAKVRQSIIRHAFRYFMGRNETLSDSKTLMDADQAYVQSGGSFDAVIVSLLTSDSFIYRKPITL